MLRCRLATWSTTLLMVLAPMPAIARDQPALQTLFERGDYQALVDRAAEGRGAGPEDTYLAALAFLKLEHMDGALAEMRRLRDQGGEAWAQVGVSGLAMLEKNHAQAVSAGRHATELAGGNPYAHYQLGLAAAGADDYATAVQAFTRATELKPDFAYAHYYAGQAHQRQRNLGKAADHYTYFLKLAPDSPDRAAVQAILRTLRK